MHSLTSCTHLPHCSRISYTTHSSHGTNLTSTHTSTSKHCTSWIVYKTHTLFLAVFSSWWSSNRAKRRNFLPFLSHQSCHCLINSPPALRTWSAYICTWLDTTLFTRNTRRVFLWALGASPWRTSLYRLHLPYRLHVCNFHAAILACVVDNVFINFSHQISEDVQAFSSSNFFTISFF